MILVLDGLIALQLIVMNRFYLIDKPLEISSFDIIRILRKKLNTRKIWHTWTLDPLATWGVILAVNNYTKLIPYLEKDRKEYKFTINLDWITDSFDLAEKIEFLDESLQKKYKKEITKEILEEILKQKFTWLITQIPPKYSALKINGIRAYKLAREGKEVEMKSREIEIFNIELLEYNYPELKLRAEVSAWTYIRSIAMDLWEILWTGWYITKLRRTKIGSLDLNNSNNLDKFEENKIVDIKKLFSHIKFLKLNQWIMWKINNWLVVKIGDLELRKNFIVWEDMFVWDWEDITNIVSFDGEYLKAIKKV